MYGKFIASKIAQMLIKLKTRTGKNPKNGIIFHLQKTGGDFRDIRNKMYALTKRKKDRDG